MTRLFLQPGIPIHEKELVGALRGTDELHRAGADVVTQAVLRAATPMRSRVCGSSSGDGALDNLLAPLEAALTLTQMHHVAASVGKHLR